MKRVIILSIMLSLTCPFMYAQPDADTVENKSSPAAGDAKELYRMMFEVNLINEDEYKNALEFGSISGDGILTNAVIEPERQKTWNILHKQDLISAEELVQMLAKGEIDDLSANEMKAFEELAPVYEPDRRKRIGYDLRRKHIAVDMIRFHHREKTKSEKWRKEAEIRAKELDMPMEIDGSILTRFNEQGRAIYIGVDNAVAAEAITVDELHPGGGSGFNLTGTNITVATWDIGVVRESHQEFGGRVRQMESSPASSHSTLVAGTLAAGGAMASAKGMAPAVNMDVNYYYNYLVKIPAYLQSNEHCRISNHSYGQWAGWTRSGGDWYWSGNRNVSLEEDDSFGRYEEESQSMDEFCYLNPYHLPVFSAGNDTREGAVSGTVHYCANPGGGWVTRSDYHPPDGYWYSETFDNHYYLDTLDPVSLAKNILTVGACHYEYYGTNLITYNTFFSSVGQTDDWRFKPEVMAKGDSVLTTDDDSDTDYVYSMGTSFSAPGIAGALALAQEWHERIYGTNSPMLSSTMKALVIHQAVVHAYYPTREWGFGRAQMRDTCQIVTNNASWNSLPHIKEFTLPDGCEAEWQVYYGATNGEPFKVTAVWTDPPGPLPSQYELDPTNAVLVNDIDVRIIGTDNSTNFPWRLRIPTSAQYPTNWPMCHGFYKEDNDRDNFEQIVIDNPTNGWYLINVSHKGTLSNGVQDVSVVITGNTPTNAPDFWITDMGATDTDGVVQLEWPGVVGGEYEVMQSMDLMNSNGWTNIESTISAYRSDMNWTNNQSAGDRCFYRLKRLR